MSLDPVTLAGEKDLARAVERTYQDRLTEMGDWRKLRRDAMARCIRVGMSHSETAAIFGVTRGYVSNIVAGRHSR